MRAPIVLLAALLTTGCVKRYGAEPAMEFADIPYAGPSGTAWPLKSVVLPGAQQRYKLGDAPKLSYVELNEGAPRTVIFLHGLGSYLKFWRSQIDETAAKGYRVIAIDQIGFGKSDKPAGFPYSTEAFAENVDELMELLHIDSAILVGHSMGGQTAMSTALRFPNRVHALVLVSPAGFETFSGREKKWFKNVYGRTLIKDADEESIWGSVRFYNFQRWSPEHEWLVEERVRLAKNADFDAYAYAQVRTVEGLAKNDFVRENAKNITAPTVIIFGNGDRLIPNGFLHAGEPRWTFEIGHEAIKGSELVEIKGCGHTIQLDCTEQFNTELFAFLKKQPEVVSPTVPDAEPVKPAEASQPAMPQQPSTGP